MATVVVEASTPIIIKEKNKPLNFSNYILKNKFGLINKQTITIS